MTSTERMAALLGRLRKGTNGAVSQAMSERGITYPLNYGVSAVTIKQEAAAYAPDHGLAKLLYRQQVRELRLAALYIADPASLTPDELDFWGEGVINTEVSEHLAFALLGRTSLAYTAVEKWLPSQEGPLRYAALMTGARYIALGGDVSGWDFTRIDTCLPAMAREKDATISGGLVNFLEKYFPLHPGGVTALRDFIRMLRATGASGPLAIAEELEWRTEKV